jgi:hypothetical protein
MPTYIGMREILDLGKSLKYPTLKEKMHMRNWDVIKKTRTYMEMRVHMDKKLLENINTLLDVKELGAKGSLKLHDVIGRIIRQSNLDQVEENTNLKRRITDLESTWIPKPLARTPYEQLEDNPKIISTEK